MPPQSHAELVSASITTIGGEGFASSEALASGSKGFAEIIIVVPNEDERN